MSSVQQGLQVAGGMQYAQVGYTFLSIIRYSNLYF